MKVSSSGDGLGCQSIYRVLGTLDGDLKFYSGSQKFGYDSFDFEAVLIGSSAVAVHADRQGIEYKTETKDLDLYTNGDFTDLEEFSRLPQTSVSGKDGAQYNYNISASGVDSNPPDTFVDVITDLEEAFGWGSEDSQEVGRMLSGEIGTSDPIRDDFITVYLPSLEGLRETFERSGRDYSSRINLIDKMLD